MAAAALLPLLEALLAESGGAAAGAGAAGAGAAGGTVLTSEALTQALRKVVEVGAAGGAGGAAVAPFMSERARDGSLASSAADAGVGPAGQRLAETFDRVGKNAETFSDRLSFGLTKAGRSLGKFISDPFGFRALASDTAQELVSLPDRIADWSRELTESQRHLSMFNGQIAAAMSEFERRRLLREMGSASRTAGSTEFLSTGLADLLDEIRPITDLMTNAFNLIAGQLTRIADTAAAIAKVAIPGLAVALWIQEHWPWGKGDDQMAPFIEFVRDVADGQLRDVVPPPP